MSTRRRIERKERKSYEWLERCFSLCLCNGNKQLASDLLRAARKGPTPLQERVHALFDEVWRMTFNEDFIPWETVKKGLEDETPNPLA